MKILNSTELLKYQKHIIIPGIGISGQNKLKNSKVAIIGMGGLGCPSSLYLAAAGVGHLTIIDHDEIDLSNLQRQVLYDEDTIKKSKAKEAEKKLKLLNKNIRIKTVEDSIRLNNAEKMLKGHDVVLDCTDNFDSRYLINDTCKFLNIPFVSGAIQGFDGQISTFNFHNGPCYRCLFPDRPSQGLAPNCNDLGTIGALPGIIGSMQALEAIKLIIGMGNPLSGKILFFDGLTFQTSLSHFESDEECKICKFSSDLNSNPIKDLNITPLLRYFHQYEDAPKKHFKSLIATEIPELKAKHFIDVREENEFKLGTIPGSINLPLSKLKEETETLHQLREICHSSEKTIIFCEAGKRSLKALGKISPKLSQNNYNLSGGFRAYTLIQ